MKVTEQNFVEQIIRKNEKALEYCMIRYGGLVKAVVHRHLGQLDRILCSVGTCRFLSL